MYQIRIKQRIILLELEIDVLKLVNAIFIRLEFIQYVSDLRGNISCRTKASI